MRQNLMNTFDDLFILNLHGNSNKKEIAPNGTKDENVFDIQQGVAIFIAVRYQSAKPAGRIKHTDLWGTRQEKYEVLGSTQITSTQWSKLTPSAPDYLFQETSSDPDNYKLFDSVVDIFPLNNCGVVTARDSFVIDIDLSALKRRIADFADSSKGDEEIRHLYFQGKGSDKYPDGDSRGWKLSAARAKVMNDESNASRYQLILYRPFDLRHVYWVPWMIDWPRLNVMNQFIEDNVGLIFTRFTKDDWSCSVTSNIMAHKAMAGYDINYVCPLYRFSERTDVVSSRNLFEKRQPNISNTFMKGLAKRLRIPENERELSPENIFNYIYAVFHAPAYRSRYAEFLKRDFPRVPLTSSLELFRALAEKGRQLVALHLLKVEDAPQLNNFITTFPVSGPNEVIKVKYDPAKQRVSINDDQYFGDVPAESWVFHIGGYQVLEKWLKDRKGRVLTFDDIQHWQRTAVALTETQRLMREIDELIPGWPLP